MNDRDEGPAPTEALGHPMVRGVRARSSHHRPGFDERPMTAAEVDEGLPTTAELPPSAADEVPREALSERVLGRQNGGASK